MKKFKTTINLICIWFMLCFFIRPLPAQGYGGALTFQGLDNITLHSASSRAAGGVSICAEQDAGLMFQNPATLHSINSIQLSIGGLHYSKSAKQEQNYAPVRYYPNLSLLLEGLTASIPDPDTALFGFTARDTVQRPFDGIGPNWSKSDKDNLPVQIMLAAPVKVSENIKIIAGVGAVEYANLDHYYQNNNVLSPSILSQRPLPTLRPTDDDPLGVDWYQTIRSRDGSINGYGFALTGSFEKYNLSIGISGMILEGNSDDYEYEQGRGHLTFFSNAFRIDSVYSRVTKTGRSDFSGQEYTISGILSGKYVSAGFSVKIPATITRKYSIEVVEKGMNGASLRYAVKDEDKMELPWRGTIGLSLRPKENLKLGLEYEYHPYGSADYVDANGSKSAPWVSASLFRAGVEYRITPWLMLRGGMRGHAEVFEPEGNKIEGEPVIYTVYSAGIGLFYSGLHFNISYENALMKYQDIWSGAISKNSERRQIVFADLSYEIPWLW